MSAGRATTPVASASTGKSRSQALIERLATPVNGASLAAFRIALGLVMCLEAYTLTQPIGSISGGLTQLQNYYTGDDSHLHFAYPGFGWLPLFSPGILNLLVILMALAGITMALGLFYRLSAVIVFLVWGYFYAVESTRTYWMSYYYLELLLTFLMIWIPAGRCFSVDAWLKQKRNQSDSTSIPLWPLVLLRGQLVITYFYAGVAKLTADWMLDGMPVRYFLTQAHVVSKVERFAPSLKMLLYEPGLALAISWIGAFFDIFVGFLLLVRRTRILGLVLMFIFHGTNHFILFNDIVWFPLVGVLTALIFLEPDWPQRAARWLKSPQIKKPDWRWFGAGAVGLPVVGAALGWRLNPTPVKASGFLPIQRWVPGFVLMWLTWQALFPARHYLIPGDARITFEGLAFSWRLKAELYRANPPQITVEDKQIISQNAAGETHVDWTKWRGEPIIYRALDLSKLNWKELPEILALYEPALGERIIYNPFSGQDAPRDENEARRRAGMVWQELHGHAPQNLRRTVPLGEIVEGYAAAIRAKGGTPPANRAELLSLLVATHGREGDRQMLPFLRRTHPFALENQPVAGGPFFLIEDPAVMSSSSSQLQLDRQRWKSLADSHKLIHRGASPVVLYAKVDPETRASLPEVALFDRQDEPGKPPVISWDFRRRLSLSKQMHISTQPFLLREYARRVADEWQKEFGHRPSVRAETSLSLNLRPPQRFVDPEADLANVGRKYFGHNSWIRDLELPRIPRESLEAAFRKP